MRGAGLELDLRAVAGLRERAEGWPGGTYLLASARSEGAEAQNVAEYLESEVLAGLTPERRAFLRRTAVLDRLCGPLCDAVTGSAGSPSELQALERAGLFLVPLHRQGRWYRYHRLFRETLLRELEDSEPELVPVLHRRAADWFEARGELEPALDHALACGDADRAARLLLAAAVPAYHAGRAGAVDTWLERFAADAVLAEYPEVAATGAWVHALQRARRADRGRGSTRRPDRRQISSAWRGAREASASSRAC